MSTEYKNMKENSKFDFEAFLQRGQGKELSLNERFKIFLTLSEVEHFVIYVEGLGFTEERAKQLGLNAIDIQKKEHKILKDCVCTNDKRPNFYKLTQEERKRFLNLFDIAASEEQKNVFLLPG